MNSEAGRFSQRIEQMEGLVHQIEQSSDPKTCDAARALISIFLEWHEAGLKKILQVIADAEIRDVANGNSLAAACTNDDLVRSLLLLHNLHPDPLEKRVEQALEEVRPYLNSHGGDVELRGISEGSVRLRMTGSCHGCPSSAATLQGTIEQAISRFAPDVTGLEVENISQQPLNGRLVTLQKP